MINNLYSKDIIKRFLPPSSKILRMHNYHNKPAILISDFDKDKNIEIVVFYKLHENVYISLLKNINKDWKIVSTLDGKYEKLDYAGILDDKIIVKWKEKSLSSLLMLSDSKLEYVNKLYPASIFSISGRKWGYINEDGNFVIEAMYDYAQAFKENIAIVVKENLYGVIDMYGNYVVYPRYNFIDEFREKRAIVVKDSSFRIIDTDGIEITQKDYSYISAFSNNRALFREGYLYGYLDLYGNEVIPAKYKDATDFREDKAVVNVDDNLYYLIGIDGDIINTYRYYFVGEIRNNLLVFRPDIDSKFGYIDESGNVIIPPKYTFAKSFEFDRAIVDISEDYTNRYGVIDKKGDFIIEPKYNDIKILDRNRLALGISIDENNPFLGSVYAIADMNGNIITDFIYYEIYEYKEGIASVYDGESTVFVDYNGVIKSDLPIVKGKGRLYLYPNLIRADIDLRTFYLDKNSKVVYKENETLLLNSKYKVIQEKFKPNKDYLVYYPQISGMENNQDYVNEKLKNLSNVKEISKDTQLEYVYTGDFYVHFFRKNLLVLNLYSYEYYFGAAHGMPNKIYVHINLENGNIHKMGDLFKKDSEYLEEISRIIREKIENDEEYSYVFPEVFVEINPDTLFYIDEKSLYIYFLPYEIGPYAAGFIQFEIPYEDIIDLIDVNGQFWKSFN
ncbi:WG containing repeat-containing protein [Alkalithermobacter thermoalcaliphilus JW-YL-7 = DSM 7308]|uniref:WG containing repeat-containing protein n=1 Tax=Alkalithermobacter thermoalcaliphilus JW-YL-7 = DSM 7308 TaxID=1121328 RepID=A0A150FQA8_CLOPD|nr:protein of unknown function DUF3298-containing protein [[Clostridium] paradoxum JW-YL-7 = DSM 7308]SHK61886.1 WG containing repeat-containing protein [[Clostridium] paradoxum JW-YL-7 = DSM 7308]